MASTTIEVAGATLTIAALAVVNAAGAVIDPASGRPWYPVAALRRPTRPEQRSLAAVDAATADPGDPLNTTIGVIATDAALTRPEAGRLALSAHDGLARAIRPAHSLMDGDTVFGLSTGTRSLPDAAAGILRIAESRAAAVNDLTAAAADTFATACVDAVICADRIGGAPSFRDLCPSAYRDVTWP